MGSGFFHFSRIPRHDTLLYPRSSGNCSLYICKCYVAFKRWYLGFKCLPTTIFWSALRINPEALTYHGKFFLSKGNDIYRWNYCNISHRIESLVFLAVEEIKWFESPFPPLSLYESFICCHMIMVVLGQIQVRWCGVIVQTHLLVECCSLVTTGPDFASFVGKNRASLITPNLGEGKLGPSQYATNMGWYGRNEKWTKALDQNFDVDVMFFDFFSFDGLI